MNKKLLANADLCTALCRILKDGEVHDASDLVRCLAQAGTRANTAEVGQAMSAMRKAGLVYNTLGTKKGRALWQKCK